MKKMIARFSVGALAVLLLCVFLTPVSVASAQNYAYRREVPSMDATAVVPLVTLRHWKDSKPNERYAFLVGMVTMLELEKEWQLRNGKKMLPMRQSLVGSWVNGFENCPLREIYDTINMHIAAHPGDLDMPVAEVLWFDFAQPKVNEGKGGRNR